MATSNGVESSRTATSNGLSSIEKEFTCAICHELFVRAHTLSCSHTFCEQCISNWLRKNKICPICRKAVVGKPVHSIVLDNAISKLIEYLPKQPDNQATTKSQTGSSNQERTTNKEASVCTESTVNGVNPRPPSSSNWRNGEENDYYDEDNEEDDDYDEEEGDYDDEEDDEEDDDDEDSYDDYLHDGFDSFHVEHHHHYYSDGYYDEDDSEEGSDDDDDYDSEEEDDSEDYDETDESVDKYDNGPDYNGLPGYYWGKYGYCFKCGDQYHWANGCPNR
ncbi:E3 ubiquitin-protein ligase rnf8-A-like [Dysidea avara]|uniref:E3 ubiquitin-protein ligase rnf8-A-like n=1 Tax=Dysidea avara TaxID=196820 RepID=UPI0033286129